VNSCESALRLPQDLMSRWVASTPAVLDLRTAEFTGVQWSQLFATFVKGGAHLTEIHIRITDPSLNPAIE
jgi:hypothetical protein